MQVPKAAFILVVQGRILASGDDPQELIARFDFSHLPNVQVKEWRTHQWGPQGANNASERCKGCSANRQVKGRNDMLPCRYPERVDGKVFVLALPHVHREDTCCNEHHHHVMQGYPHRNCILR